MSDFQVLGVTKVLLKEKFVLKKDWIKYLVLVNYAKEIGQIIRTATDKGFNAFVDKHLQAHLAGKEVPAEIATAIMNLADDHLAGREMVVRSGDYISLQNFYRETRR